ncbi:hypothetical protein TIFTF001_022748 [Ficus carica]|uniref:Uncharacterized protein n=1 Tax=Ficus carica TaxID=3494 RepID=A0AA88AJ64_FICCA|nr:hypothetical protein TIFTF001_022748 [Ficus carica]
MAEKPSKGIVAVNPKPSKGFTSNLIDWVENLVVKFMYNSSHSHHYLSGDFAPVRLETPPTADLPVSGSLPVSDSFLYKFYCFLI